MLRGHLASVSPVSPRTGRRGVLLSLQREQGRATSDEETLADGRRLGRAAHSRAGAAKGTKGSGIGAPSLSGIAPARPAAAGAGLPRHCRLVQSAPPPLSPPAQGARGLPCLPNRGGPTGGTSKPGAFTTGFRPPLRGGWRVASRLCSPTHARAASRCCAGPGVRGTIPSAPRVLVLWRPKRIWPTKAGRTRSASSCWKPDCETRPKARRQQARGGRLGAGRQLAFTRVLLCQRARLAWPVDERPEALRRPRDRPRRGRRSVASSAPARQTAPHGAALGQLARQAAVAGTQRPGGAGQGGRPHGGRVGAGGGGDPRAPEGRVALCSRHHSQTAIARGVRLARAVPGPSGTLAHAHAHDPLGRGAGGGGRLPGQWRKHGA